MPADPPERDLADMALARTRSRPSPSRRRGGAPGVLRDAGSSRDPQLLGSAVERLVTEQDWSEDLLAAGLVARWAQVVGDDVAAHVSVDTFDPQSRRLLLRADSTAWATQVRLLLPTLRARISDEIGPVGEIEIVGPAAPSWVHGQRHVRGRGPRDTYG